jgi:hypothetical protein
MLTQIPKNKKQKKQKRGSKRLYNVRNTYRLSVMECSPFPSEWAGIDNQRIPQGRVCPENVTAAHVVKEFPTLLRSNYCI